MARPTTVRRVAVVGGNRIPFARSDRQYARASNVAMLTAAIDGLAQRYALDGERAGEVVANGRTIAVPHPGCYPLVEHERHAVGVLELHVADGVTCHAVQFTAGVV